MAARGRITTALVVRTIPFGETSQVVHLATPEHGLVAALAKGSRRPGPEFRGGIPLGALGEAVLSPRRGELEALRRFTPGVALRGLSRSLPRYYAGSYVIDLVRTWLRPALPLPALFRAATTALKAIAAGSEDSVASWVVWFEARAVAAAGHRPRLEACSVCEGMLDAGVLSPAAGGVVHPRCRPPGDGLRLSSVALATLRRLYAARLADLAREPLSPAEVRQARAAHDLWVPWVLESRPASLSWVPRP
jgi:DNA repair protein RecO (recombination protein O)